MKTVSIAILAAFAFLSITKAGPVIFTNLYSFSATAVVNPAEAAAYGGNSPLAALLLSGNMLYGTTSAGSSNNDGTIFACSLAGSLTSLHTFTGRDGADPQSDLIQSGSALYGTTSKGGAYGGGTVFAVNTNGTGFTNLFSFAYTNGGNPLAGLCLSGSTLYGTASKGGAYGAGTIFAMSTNGTGFTNIFSFNYTNGANPEADLLLLGGTLYGTTVNGGGSNGQGTVFAVNTDGTGFTNLCIFNYTNGSNPQAGLTLLGNVLCGTTVYGGTDGEGTVFSIGTNGSGFNEIYNFGLSELGDGSWPYCRLVVHSNNPSSYSLCGTTEFGTSESGETAIGTVFTVNVAGPQLAFNGFNVVYDFGVGEGDTTGEPEEPLAGLVISNGTLYGTTETGGQTTGNGGCVFSVSYTNGNSFSPLHLIERPPGLENANRDGADPLAGLVLSGNTLYGTASAGGAVGDGTVFAINTDGSGFRPLEELGGYDVAPWASLILSNNTLYGTAEGGTGGGAVFSLNVNGSNFTTLVEFPDQSDENPKGSLVLAGNTLYGTTCFSGGGGEYGSVFAVSTDESGYRSLLDFNGTDGIFPEGGLAFDGSTLYGTASAGGSGSGLGTVFAISTNGTDITNICNFSGTNGTQPVGDLVLSGNTLYGVTEYDSHRACGTIFAVNTDGSGFTNLYDFNGPDGEIPAGSLVLCGSTLYGTTTAGGTGGYGTVFSINTDGSCFTNLYNFSGGNDGAVPYDGLILSGNTLYGTTSSGGRNGSGTVFALSLGAIPLNVEPAGANGNVVLTWGNPAFTLQAAPAVNGPYATISEATSPYTNTVTAAQQYFRLQE